MVLNLGSYETPKKLAEEISLVSDIPSTIKIIDSSTGLMNEGKENQRPWGNLIGVNVELYEKFESIGQEKFCPSFKIKLKDYNGENLQTLLGSEISFSSYEIAFVFDKFKQPIGLALVLELNDISF